MPIKQYQHGHMLDSQTRCNLVNNLIAKLHVIAYTKYYRCVSRLTYHDYITVNINLS